MVPADYIHVQIHANGAVRRGVRNHPSKAVRGHSSQFLESLEFWSSPKELRYIIRAEERIRPRFCADNDLIPELGS